MATEQATFMVEDAQIIFRNFEGKEGQYNRKGDRNFGVILDPKTAQKMLKDGWNVKFLRSREEDETETPWVQVSVNFENRPPRVVMITSTSRTNLDESTVEVLDWADIQTVDLIARAYNWEVNGKTGIKAYLKSMFVTIEEDELERKYGINDLPGGTHD
jgi:hypothetical protein